MLGASSFFGEVLFTSLVYIPKCQQFEVFVFELSGMN